MEYRMLGNTGMVVSTRSLGTMTFGSESEAIIGRWLAARSGVRDRVVVATKGRFARGDGPNDVGLSRPSLTRALEASLRRLGVEVIDLYQVHA